MVEDNLELLSCLGAILSSQGYQVEAKKDTVGIWQDINSFNPDLLLLDVWVKPIPGNVVAQKLNEIEQEAVPIILISAADNLSTVAADVGVEHYLRKPFEIEQLLELVEEMVAEN